MFEFYIYSYKLIHMNTRSSFLSWWYFLPSSAGGLVFGPCWPDWPNSVTSRLGRRAPLGDDIGKWGARWVLPKVPLKSRPTNANHVTKDGKSIHRKSKPQALAPKSWQIKKMTFAQSVDTSTLNSNWKVSKAHYLSIKSTVYFLWDGTRFFLTKHFLDRFCYFLRQMKAKVS